MNPGLSSHGSGADLRCTVTREGETYYLSGEKHLITFGLSCDWWLLFARVQGSTGKDGIVALMVDRDTQKFAFKCSAVNIDGKQSKKNGRAGRACID